MSKASFHSGIKTGRGRTFNRATTKKLRALNRYADGKPVRNPWGKREYRGDASFGPTDPVTLGDLLGDAL